MWTGALVLVSVVGFSAPERILGTRPNTCEEQCGRFYSLHGNQFEQINDSWSSCVHGCEFYSRLEQRVGDNPINTLQNCNYSCDERYEEGSIQACQAGCGFNFDKATTELPATTRIERLPSAPAPSSRPSFISLSLPRLFDQINQAMPKLNQIMERTFSNPFDDEYEFNLPSLPSISSLPALPRLPGGLFGRRQDDNVDPLLDNLFSTIHNQMNNMMKSMPAMPKMGGLGSWSPFPRSGGEITVIKAGPGFVEEKHYDIGPDGRIVEVTEPAPLVEGAPMVKDALEHENPMDLSFNESDVELIDPVQDLYQPQVEDGPEHRMEPDQSSEEVPRLAEEELPKELEEVSQSLEEVPRPLEEVKLELDPENQFLSVIRNSIQESERFKEEVLNKYRSLKDAEYSDNSCSSEHLRWSDWVACVHVKLGVPRWLTAATIAFGVIFSVWLCLVIPTAAPKQRIRAFLVKTEKLSPPSAVVGKEMTTAEAKEAEANASREPTISIIKVDLPPSYTDVTPGSPAPSYKSNMAPPTPGSPAPSYRSVDIPVENDKDVEAGKGKESNA